MYEILVTYYILEEVGFIFMLYIPDSVLILCIVNLHYYAYIHLKGATGSPGEQGKLGSKVTYSSISIAQIQ